MIIGKLRHYVELQASSDTKDTFGENTKVWTTEEYIFAAIAPLRGNETIENEQMNAEMTHRIIIRPTSNAKANKRILFGTRIFDINVVRDIDERGVMMEMFCKELVVL